MQFTGIAHVETYDTLSLVKSVPIVVTVSGKLLTVAVGPVSRRYKIVVAIKGDDDVYRFSERNSYRYHPYYDAVQCGSLDLPIVAAACELLGLNHEDPLAGTEYAVRMTLNK